MYSREESKKIREAFWTGFGKHYPRKWLLYNTRIKGLSLRFSFTRKAAAVSLDLECNDELMRDYYWEKLVSLRNILLEEYLPGAVYEPHYTLENAKVISRIYIEKAGVNIHNQKDWAGVQQRLYEHMEKLEGFFKTYRDFIES